VKGGKFISLKYGFSKYSVPTYFNVDYGFSFKDKMVLRASAFFEHGTVGSTKFNIPGLAADFSYNVFGIKNRLFGNLSLGGFSALELLSSDRNSSLGITQFIFGGKASAELDLILSRRFSLKYEFSHYYAHKSQLGNWYYTNTLGLCFILN
jgi:hypothetical protein